VDFSSRESFRLQVIKYLENKYSSTEVWAFHPNYLNILVSSSGRVKNAMTNVEFSVRKTYQGYCVCSVPMFQTTGFKKSKSVLIHRLVAETFFTFLPNPKEFEVNHISGIKTDNSIFNLNWMTRQENLQHARDNKLFKPCYGSDNGRFKHLDSILNDIAEFKRLGYTYVDIGKAYNLSGKYLTSLLKRRGVNV
jgi:hypothetical protein